MVLVAESLLFECPFDGVGRFAFAFEVFFLVINTRPSFIITTKLDHEVFALVIIVSPPEFVLTTGRDDSGSIERSVFLNRVNDVFLWGGSQGFCIGPPHCSDGAAIEARIASQESGVVGSFVMISATWSSFIQPIDGVGTRNVAFLQVWGMICLSACSADAVERLAGHIARITLTKGVHSAATGLLW